MGLFVYIWREADGSAQVELLRSLLLTCTYMHLHVRVGLTYRHVLLHMHKVSAISWSVEFTGT